MKVEKKVTFDRDYEKKVINDFHEIIIEKVCNSMSDCMNCPFSQVCTVEEFEDYLSDKIATGFDEEF